MIRAKNKVYFKLEELPTWLIIFITYGSWFLLIVNFTHLHPLLAMLLMTLVLTLHSSLSHELIHGHPTENQTLNNLIAYPPIGLIYPYTVFRETHLIHHDNKNITLPGVDPESFFNGAEPWQKRSQVFQYLAWFNMTLFGRLLIGPGVSVVLLTRYALQEIFQSSLRRKLMWTMHFAMTISLVVVLYRIFNIAPWQYLLCAYAAMSLIQLRSFYEHRPETIPTHRSVIQEACPFFSLLFLNNNYHYVHHKNPNMPWHQIKREYWKNQTQYLTENGQFQVKGYSNWLRYLFRPINSPVHPFHKGS